MCTFFAFVAFTLALTSGNYTWALVSVIALIAGVIFHLMTRIIHLEEQLTRTRSLQNEVLEDEDDIFANELWERCYN
jgi:uncharacterized membrane protein